MIIYRSTSRWGRKRRNKKFALRGMPNMDLLKTLEVAVSYYKTANQSSKDNLSNLHSTPMFEAQRLEFCYCHISRFCEEFN